LPLVGLFTLLNNRTAVVFPQPLGAIKPKINTQGV
jgi:hypothetical protein